MTTFNDNIVLQYDDHIARVVPGYALMTAVTVAYCQTHCPDYARILVVGAGTGHELEKLCQANPTWSFVAVEPALAMLRQAQQRCQDYESRIDWHHGVLDTLGEESKVACFDVGVCLLVIHFLENEDKRQFLQSLAKLIVPMGILLLSQRLLFNDEPFLDSEIAYALACGHPLDMQDTLRQRLLDLSALSETEALKLYRQCNFAVEQTLVKVLSYQLTALQVAV